jgi:hypothetical protein
MDTDIIKEPEYNTKFILDNSLNNIAVNPTDTTNTSNGTGNDNGIGNGTGALSKNDVDVDVDPDSKDNHVNIALCSLMCNFSCFNSSQDK